MEMRTPITTEKIHNFQSLNYKRINHVYHICNQKISSAKGNTCSINIKGGVAVVPVVIVVPVVVVVVVVVVAIVL